MKYFTGKNVGIATVLVIIGAMLSLFVTDKNDKEFLVLSVIDGDTIDVAEGRVRLLGVDAPERGDCYYEESKEFLMELIEGKEVRLQKDISEKDMYDRLLRYVVIDKEGEDGVLVNDYIVRHGMAMVVSSPPDKLFRDLLYSAQEEAKRERRGLWGECEIKETVNLREKDSLPDDPKCLIKGNISEKGYGKTYLIPGCDNYDTVKIDTRKGEMYFCSEQEAIDADFRKATNCP